MAKTNKYTSLNFNDVYEKKILATTNNNNNNNNNNHRSSSSSSISSTNPSFNKTALSNSRIHGNMLVLTRPSPKPIPPPPPPAVQPPDRSSIEPDSISLRPLGRTGTATPLPCLTVVSVSPRSNKFVPPHLRPGFQGREEKPEQLSFRQSPRFPIHQVEEARPKSGGGYEASSINRPRSSGPFSSG